MKTKIICTIGPGTNNEETLKQLIKAGMSVARINCSHGGVEANEANIALVKKVREEMGVPLAVMLDTKGPDVRIGHFDPAVKKDGGVWLVEGQVFTLQTRPTVGFENRVFVDYKKLPKVVKPGQQIILNDGMIVMTVASVNEFEVICRVNIGGKLSDRKSVFVPGCNLGIPFISKADELDIIMACKMGVDWVAASFVNSANDVVALRKLIQKYGGDFPIISKIESRRGVENIDEILRVSDGIMVARGDLGVEYPIEQIPALQKTIIRKARRAGKLVVTATEMLESMIEKPRPTRAETTDVANSIYDGTSCVMLSGETAVGKYPVKAVEYMKRIAEETHKYVDYSISCRNVDVNDVKDALARTIVSGAVHGQAKLICSFARSGDTTRAVAKYYPNCPIIAFVKTEQTFHRLAIVNDVEPVMITPDPDRFLTPAQIIEYASAYVLNNKIVKKGDVIAIGAESQMFFQTL